MAVLPAAQAAALAFHWWSEAGSAPQADTVCSKSAGVCHSFGHFVFLATPGSGDATVPLDSVARFGMDGGRMLAGPAPIFEKHLATGICEGADHSDCRIFGPSQVYQLNQLTVQAMVTDEKGDLVPPANLPQSICAEVDLFELAKPSDLTRASKLCANFSAPVVLEGQDSSLAIELNTFSTVATSVCNASNCQTDMHVMFFVAGADPTHLLEAWGEYSTDGSRTTSSEVGIYEQHVNKQSDGLYKQAWQFNAQIQSDKVLATEVCYSIVVKDTMTKETATLNDCIQPCQTLVPFHNAAGYCPQQIVV
jgi:hypothetical protein